MPPRQGDRSPTVPPQETLDDMLEHLHQEGQFESQGHFTLDRRQALDKLSGFQLPTTHSWILKAVQSAVRLGAERIDIEVRYDHTRVRFWGGQSLSLEQIEAAYFEVESQGRTALDHLKKALWGCAVQFRKPFQLQLANQPTALVGLGQNLSKRNLQPHASTTLCVYHGTFEGSGSMLKSAANKWGSVTHEVERELTELAYVCPVPLRLDKKRIDSLLYSPYNGFSPNNFPISVGWECGQGPTFQLPPGIWQDFHLPESDYPAVHKLLKVPKVPDNPVEWAYVASTAIWSSNERGFELQPRPSACHWIVDGVICHTQPLPLRGPISLGLYLSGSESTVDLTGLQIIETGQSQQQIQRVVPAVLQVLRKREPDWAPLNAELSRTSLRKVVSILGFFIGAASFVGAAATHLNPILCAVTLLVGVPSVLSVNVQSRHGELQQGDFKNRLPSEWNEFVREWNHQQVQPPSH